LAEVLNFAAHGLQQRGRKVVVPRALQDPQQRQVQLLAVGSTGSARWNSFITASCTPRDNPGTPPVTPGTPLVHQAHPRPPSLVPTESSLASARTAQTSGTGLEGKAA